MSIELTVFTKMLTDEDEHNQTEPKSSRSSPKYGIRHIQTLLAFALLCLGYAHRINISIAIVAMLDNSDNKDFEKYSWNAAQQSYILSSFFWGYAVMQIPAGPLGHRFGAKKLLFVSCLGSSLGNLFIPIAASVGGWGLVCAMRVVMGIFQGLLYSSTHTFVTKWIPSSERGSLGTFIYAGAQFGTVAAMAISGVLASSWGWPSIFYLSGGFGVLWCIFWLILGAESPADHKMITPEERKFIETSSGLNAKSHSKLSVPWVQILKSTPFWALLVLHCGHNWGLWVLLTNIPTYMKNILHFDIKSNGVLSALPYFVKWILSMSMGVLSDYMNNRKMMSLTTNKKIFNSIAYWAGAVLLVALAFISEDHTILAVTILVIAVGFNSGSYVGLMVNHIELSPNFAGTLMGLTNFTANFVSIIVPLAVGLIITNKTDPTQWQIVFFISAGIYFVTNLIYVIFGTAKIQSWNETQRIS